MCTQWMASIIEDRHIHQSEDICWVSFIAIKDADDYTEYYFLFNIPPQLRKYHKYQTIFSIFLSDNNTIDWTASGRCEGEGQTRFVHKVQTNSTIS